MKKTIIMLLAAFMLPACRHAATRSAAPAVATADVADTYDERPIDELPLPTVPSTLTEPSARAAYIIDHFWDAMDFRDTLRSHDNDFMEQNFANFIGLFPYTDEESRRSAVGKLLNLAEADTAAYYLLADIAEKYLYEPNSPMLSEDYYILFLERFASSPVLGEYGTMRPRWQLEAARKNRPGMKAADFVYTTREGRRTTLRSTPTRGGLLVAIFYDPDCGHCKEIVTGLAENEMLSGMVADGSVTVLAVHSGDQHELWQETADRLPVTWTVGYESGRMQTEGAYVFRAMPTIYLLDADKRVLLKDVLPDRLLYTLYELR